MQYPYPVPFNKRYSKTNKYMITAFYIMMLHKIASQKKLLHDSDHLIYIYIYIYIYSYVCIYIHTSVCVNIYIYIYIYMCVCVCVYIISIYILCCYMLLGTKIMLIQHEIDKDKHMWLNFWI